MKHLIISIFICCIATSVAHGQHDAIPPTDEFNITGAVKHTLKFSLKDLLTFHQDSLGDLVIKNKRGEDKSTAKNMKGVLLKTVLDSAHIYAEKPKEFSEYIITLIASDNYKNVYSWNELFNTDIGKHVYIITEMDGKSITEMPDRILVLSLSDFNSGRRHLKGLTTINVKKIDQ